MTNRRRVGAVDSIWLNMHRPNNLMVIDSVMWFDEPVDWERLAAVLQRRVVDRYPVFRQRPVEAARMPIVDILWRGGLFEPGPLQTGGVLPRLAFGEFAIDDQAEALLER